MINLQQEMNLEIQKGALLPTIAMSHLLNGKFMIEELKQQDLKSKISSFVDSKASITFSDIMDEFNLTVEQTSNLLEEMEDEGLIRQS